MHKLSQKKFKSAQNERLCGIEHCTPAIHFEMRRERQSIQSFIHWKVQLLKRKDKEEDGETLRKFSHLLVSASFFLMLMMILMILPYFCVHRVHNCRINKTILNIFLIEILNALLSFSFIVSQIRFLLLPLIPGSMPSSFFYFYCSRWNFLSFYRFFFSSVSVLFFYFFLESLLFFFPFSSFSVDSSYQFFLFVLLQGDAGWVYYMVQNVFHKTWFTSRNKWKTEFFLLFSSCWCIYLLNSENFGKGKVS